jgi:crossover junction endodeoxyribonuclease RusA
MTRLYFRVNARPVPKARPRLGKGVVYTPKRTKVFEQMVGWEAKQAMMAQGWEITSSSVALHCTFHQAHKLCDLSNLIKAVEDACNGVVWVDDVQVVSLVAEYGAGEPGVDVEVEVAA